MLARHVGSYAGSAAEMTVRKWFGYRAYSPSPITDVFGEFDATFDMDFSNMHSGDTIVGYLAGYRLQTVPVANGDGPELCPFPWAVRYSYFPSPDGEPGADASAVGGDALFRDDVRWVPHQLDTGAGLFTYWYADSGPLQHFKAQRKVIDKTSAGIFLQAETANADPGFDSEFFIYADVMIMMHIEILVQSNFG